MEFFARAHFSEDLTRFCDFSAIDLGEFTQKIAMEL